MPIRSATLSDLPAILAIEQQSPSAAHWAPDRYNKLLDLDNDSGIVLVAEEAGKVGGFICAKAVAGEWDIENVVVAADLLRRGIASELLSKLTERARREAASAILLEVRESNRPARRLYEKCGFGEVGRRGAYYSDPAEDGILYTLRLDR
jgi:ribosomal-protein-alanine N-acetyltransferase